jgi:hypothetical protein
VNVLTQTSVFAVAFVKVDTESVAGKSWARDVTVRVCADLSSLPNRVEQSRPGNRLHLPVLGIQLQNLAVSNLQTI